LRSSKRKRHFILGKLGRLGCLLGIGNVADKIGSWKTGCQSIHSSSSRFFLAIVPKRKKYGNLAARLYSGVAPEEYADGEELPVWITAVKSRRSLVALNYNDLAVCPSPLDNKRMKRSRKRNANI
jgi:hypothetical protein